MKNILKGAIWISFFCFCACSKHTPAVYEVVGMSLGNSNNTGENPFDASIDSIPKQAYAIKITLNEVMRIKREGDAQENGFINEDQLTSLNIFSLNNFDGSHTAGTSLNSYFLTQLNSSATIDGFISKGQIGGGKYNGGNYIDSWSTDQYFYLMIPPSSPSSQSFVVEIGFSDGRSMSDTIKVKLY
ncbi:MAG: DUF5034 domain-containing protein [Bacteroidetes bacterium]|nr:DUF5034 domain-containing protein [Bacteroidota bacterium]